MGSLIAFPGSCEPKNFRTVLKMRRSRSTVTAALLAAFYSK
jgi:hypothetical protein